MIIMYTSRKAGKNEQNVYLFGDRQDFVNRTIQEAGNCGSPRFQDACDVYDDLNINEETGEIHRDDLFRIAVDFYKYDACFNGLGPFGSDPDVLIFESAKDVTRFKNKTKYIQELHDYEYVNSNHPLFTDHKVVFDYYYELMSKEIIMVACATRHGTAELHTFESRDDLISYADNLERSEGVDEWIESELFGEPEYGSHFEAAAAYTYNDYRECRLVDNPDELLRWLDEFPVCDLFDEIVSALEYEHPDVVNKIKERKTEDLKSY